MRIANRKSRIMFLAVFMLFCISSVGKAAGLMPDDIITMHENGKSVNQIVTEIQNQGIDFDVNLQVLEQLIQKGVSQEVLEVLLGDNSPVAKNPKKPIVFSGSTQPGIAVITDPPGLSLEIDGHDHGITPSLSNKIVPGKHTIKVAHPLFFTRQEKIQFDGENFIVLNWKMEPREPIVRIAVNIKRGNSKEPWSWIIRPRGYCPGCEVNLKFQAWKATSRAGEAVFLLTEEAKRLFRGTGIGCLEMNIWKGEVRRDLPLRALPPPMIRYFITDIQVNGINTIDIRLDIEVRELNATNPDVKMIGDSGFLIKAELDPEDKKKKKTYED
ncbi:PEGA domain-containing protein, partial [bacterium]|nr:PEGA domain-containing protein [bacterium]